MHKKFFQTLAITTIITLAMNVMPHQVRSETPETRTQVNQLKNLLKGPLLSEQQMKQKVIEMGVDPKLVAQYPGRKLPGGISNNANVCGFLSWLICKLLGCGSPNPQEPTCPSCIEQLEAGCMKTNG